MNLSRKKDVEYFVTLLAILSIGSFFIFLASPNKDLQFLLIFLMTSFYVIFGIIHHLVNHDISASIVLEYLLIGGLGVSILFFFLKGGLFV